MKDTFSKDLFKKKICITGVSGFIGSKLYSFLKGEGLNVIGTSRSISSKDCFVLDLQNKKGVIDFFKEKKIDVVFHLAAESLVESGQEDPYGSLKNNLDSTLNILESSRINNLKKIIIASTSHVYGKNKVPYYEGYTPKPTRPYETSKACIDLIAQTYSKNFRLPVYICRFVNIYGPSDLHFNRLIPKITRDLIRTGNITIWGGSIVRDYLYIDDAVDAYFSIYKKKYSEKDNNIYNFGGGNPISVLDLAKKIGSLYSKTFKINYIKTQRDNEIEKQYVSFSKAKRLLKWCPRISLDNGLKNTLDWYEMYLKKNDNKMLL